MGWLDVVRFADTCGYHSDNPHNVWPYRDYVIKTFNDNKPFDQFTVEQLAGDLLPNATTEQKVAPCFNHLLLTTEEAAPGQGLRARMLTDRVRAVSTVRPGQTFGCCQCHDHKFDPVTARDFYALGALFADIQEPIIGRRDPGMVLVDDKQKAEQARLKKEVDDLQKQLEGKKPEPAELKTKLAAARKALADYEVALPRCMVSVTGGPRIVRLLPRGNWLDQTGPVMQPALPKYLAPGRFEETRRLIAPRPGALIASRDNPLTAAGLRQSTVETVVRHGSEQDVGRSGIARRVAGPPGAARLPGLRVHGQRLERQARDPTAGEQSDLSPGLHGGQGAAGPRSGQPPAGPAEPVPAEAELVRDNALKISGLLSAKVGGPSVKPYQPAGYWENLNFPARQYQADAGESQYRRGLYTWWQRSFPHPA